MKRIVQSLFVVALLTLALSACLHGHHRGPCGQRGPDCEARPGCDKAPCDVKGDCRQRCKDAPCAAPAVPAAEPAAK